MLHFEASVMQIEKDGRKAEKTIVTLTIVLCLFQIID